MRLDRSGNSSSPLIAEPGVTLVPFRTTQNGLISVETEFDGNPFVNAILDSGASSTVISEAAVQRLNLGDQIIKGQTTSVIGAAGITENVRMLFIRNCRVADQLQSNLRAQEKGEAVDALVASLEELLASYKAKRTSPK